MMTKMACRLMTISVQPTVFTSHYTPSFYDDDPLNEDQSPADVIHCQRWIH